MTPEEHRELGKELFNRAWTLMELERRAPDEDDELVYTAHASRYHWSRVGGPEHAARGEWQCSRVYAVLGRGEPAVHHATRCLEICRENGIGDWDLAFAYEALSRAHRVSGDDAEAERYKALAVVAGEAIADAEDREILEKDLATL
jgi:hypothetical protein